jgi:ABC-type phosphate transport system substrate-binding protein
MNRFLWLLACMIYLLLPQAQAQDMVVIVSVDSGVEKLSRDEVINIFMGRYRKLPDGVIATPLDIDGETDERREFYQKLLGKSLAEVNAYWARLIFSGRTAAPEDLATQHHVLDRVARDRNAIGYVERRNLSKNVKVVYELPD